MNLPKILFWTIFCSGAVKEMIKAFRYLFSNIRVSSKKKTISSEICKKNWITKKSTLSNMWKKTKNFYYTYICHGKEIWRTDGFTWQSQHFLTLSRISRRNWNQSQSFFNLFIHGSMGFESRKKGRKSRNNSNIFTCNTLLDNLSGLMLSVNPPLYPTL